VKKEKSVTPGLKSGNKAHLLKICKDAKLSAQSLGILYLIADVLDVIAEGHNTYVIIGSTKAKDAYTISVKGDDEQDTIYADEWDELCTKAFDLV